MDLKNLNLVELKVNEAVELQGGVFFIPILAIYGAAACLSACGVTAAMYYGYHNNK